MAAYLVLMQEIDDVARYRGEYLPAVRPFLQKYGAEMLVAGSELNPNGAVRYRGTDRRISPVLAAADDRTAATESRGDSAQSDPTLALLCVSG